MNDKAKIEIMAATVQTIINLIETRLNSRLDTLQALAIQPMDSIPESIKNKREDECAKIRAVVQEQRDLSAIIKVLFPTSIEPLHVSKPVKKVRVKKAPTKNA